MREPQQALADLEGLLEDLDTAAHQGAVLVEGRRDTQALEALGVGGDIRVLNRGVSLLTFCEELLQERRHVVVLVDWDEKGDELASRLRGALTRGGVTVDLQIRARLRQLTRGSIHAVEELASFHRRVEAAAAAKGPDRATAGTWKERKEENLRRRAIRKQRGAPPGRRP